MPASNKYYAPTGRILGFKHGIPVLEKGGVTVISRKEPGPKYQLVDQDADQTVVEKYGAGGSRKKPVISTVRRNVPLKNINGGMKSAYQIFCEEIKIKKMKEKANFPITREIKGEMWKYLKEMLQNGEIKPTKRDIHGEVSKMYIE